MNNRFSDSAIINAVEKTVSYSCDKQIYRTFTNIDKLALSKKWIVDLFDEATFHNMFQALYYFNAVKIIPVEEYSHMLDEIIAGRLPICDCMRWRIVDESSSFKGE